MFIRKDLEEEIKSKFGIEKFTYKDIGQNIFNDFDLLIFDTGKDILAIEIRPSYHYIYKVKELPNHPGKFFKIKKEISTLYTFGRQTYLKANDVTTKFPGTAFDFTEELVLLALENC